jgi:hypothetical protein
MSCETLGIPPSTLFFLHLSGSIRCSIVAQKGSMIMAKGQQRSSKEAKKPKKEKPKTNAAAPSLKIGEKKK